MNRAREEKEPNQLSSVQERKKVYIKPAIEEEARYETYAAMACGLKPGTACEAGGSSNLENS